LVDLTDSAGERHLSPIMTGPGQKYPARDESPRAESADRILSFITQIAVAYLSANAVDARAVPELLRGITSRWLSRIRITM
jgi:hypothetical protein